MTSAALRLLPRIVAVFVALVSALPAVSETGTGRKTDAEDSAAPVPKKKAHSKATPKPDLEQKHTAATAVGATTKTKATNAATSPKAKNADTGAADARSESAATAPTAPTASIAPDELLEFHAQPAGVKKLIESSLDLARRNLTYTFGSSDPASGGLDCSGFVHHVLRQHGFTQVPRDSSEQYVWVRRARGFRAVVSRKAESFEMDELLPGDLLFWTGTYATAHDPPISHVMLYLGTEKSTGAKVMIGSSDGRTYQGKKRNGVSVFDFAMPRTPIVGDPRSTFVGYARIPGLRD